MSVNFADGPAQGTVLQLRRAPIFLRAVWNPRSKSWDALDQPDDVPAANESIHVYRWREKPGYYHLLCSGRGGRAATGWYARATYYHVPDGPPEAVLRDTAQWVQWCLARYRSETPEAPTDDPPGNQPDGA